MGSQTGKLSVPEENMIGEDEESYLRRRVLTIEGSGQTIGPPAQTLIKHVGHQLRYCNTPYYSSPNLTLITIISSLVMRDAAGLINSKSSQRPF
jgi:hypothetical protein